MAALEATTVLACRNRDKAEAAAREVTRRTWNDDVHVVSLDLADLASVGKAADDILTRWDRLDVLVNNAGGTWSERQVTAQGFEYTFGVNHLGHFYLTNLLLASPRGQCSVSDHQRHLGGPPLRPGTACASTTCRASSGYDAMEAYCRSKLANVLFTRQLAKRLGDQAVTVNAVHPGPVRSGFGMDGDLHGLHGLRHDASCAPSRSVPSVGAKTSRLPGRRPPRWQARPGMYWVRSKPGHMSRRARDDEARLPGCGTRARRCLSSAGFALG